MRLSKRPACDIVVASGDALFAELVREHASTRQLAEAAEGLASFKETRTPGWYRATA